MKIRRVAGLDLGIRKAAISVFWAATGDESGDEEWTDFEMERVEAMVTPPQARNEELWKLSTRVAQFIKDERIEVVFIEKPLVGNNVDYSMRISQMCGAIMSRITCRCEFVDVGTWKKQVVGNGAVKKHDIAMFLKETYPTYSDACEGDQDCVDATCIGLYGCRTLILSQRLAVPGCLSE